MTNNQPLKSGDKTKAKIKTWELGVTPNTQTKYVRVKFTGGIDWTGWISKKATENTMKTLEDMGFKGSNLKMLANDNALDTSIEYDITIGEVRNGKEGKKYYAARWVNKPFVTGFKKSKDGDLDDFDIDTSAYISGTVDDAPPTNPNDPEGDEEYSIPTDANFAADDIPF